VNRFQFDRGKSEANRKKHGIDFEEAQRLWADPNLVEIEARSEDEPRSLVIGNLDGKIWSAVVTQRADDIRIISVRRSRPSEVMIYES